MAAHLLTVHLPLYTGVLAVLITTTWTIVGEMRWSRVRAGWWIALGGALLSVVGEAWHAVTLTCGSNRTSGAVAGSLSPLGLAVVAATVWHLGRRAATDGESTQRRAA